MGHYLGIDLGGTNIVAGVVNEKYALCNKVRKPTLPTRSLPDVVADMAAAGRQALQEAGLAPADIAYVGLGVPSTINPETQRVVNANNLGWKDADVIGEFRKNWDVPVLMGNDADCAVLGESLAGAAAAYSDVLMVTLGTGLGGGIVLQKKLFLGGDGVGIEPGHTLLEYDGFPCTCGKMGCLEAYVSVTALTRQTIDMMMVHAKSLMWEQCGHDLNRVNGRTAFDAARRGDKPAKMVVNKYIDYLAAGLASMITLLRPQVVIVGGGLSNEGDNLLRPLYSKVSETIFSCDLLSTPPIIRAALGNDAGIIGAALLGL